MQRVTIAALRRAYRPRAPWVLQQRLLCASPRTLPTAHADAFTGVAFRGNPACVVLLESGLPAASDEAWMQHVANEMHLSETAFLVPREDEALSFDLRWFTPTVEVDLCGHATLASSHVLWSVHGFDASRSLTFHTKSGVLTASRDAEGFIELNFPAEPPAEVTGAQGAEEMEQVQHAFGLSPGDVLSIERNRMDVIAEVTPEAFVRLKPAMSEVMKVPCRVLSVTTAGCPASLIEDPSLEYDFTSRAFAPLAGVDEDPVCGSAHCALGPFWQARLGKAELLARAASPRGGDVRVRVQGERVLLAGQAVTTMTGTLLHVGS